MLTVKPVNHLRADLGMLFKGLYGTYGASAGQRYKMAFLITLYHAHKSPAVRIMGGFGDALCDSADLRLVSKTLCDIAVNLAAEGDSTLVSHTTLHEFDQYAAKRTTKEIQWREPRRTWRTAIELYLDVIESARWQGSEQPDPALAAWMSKMLSWDISGVDVYDELRELRELLATQIGGALLYRDDGELSDSSAHPSIDFRRDTPDAIRRALRRRAQLKRPPTGEQGVSDG